MNIVEVYFENTKSSTFFRNNGLSLKINLTVLVDTDKGLQFGKIIKIIRDVHPYEEPGIDIIPLIDEEYFK